MSLRAATEGQLKRALVAADAGRARRNCGERCVQSERMGSLLDSGRGRRTDREFLEDS